MQIGDVVKKYRKEKGMTQEEMARRLGVTAPAVNKWENGNSMPDIMLLAPIARLLGISLDTLFSFRSQLTDLEINELVAELGRRMDMEPYGQVFQWAKRQMEEYPDCEHLILWMTVSLEANSLIKELPETELSEREGHNAFFRDCYERLLDSQEEYVRTTAAGSLYNYYVREGQYEKAGEYLKYLPNENPERKRKQALLYAKEGRREEAYKAYEELLYAGYQMMNLVLHSMFEMRLEKGELEQARFLEDKLCGLASLLEMGEYVEYSVKLELMQAEKDVEGTLECVRHMLASIGTIGGFSKSPLYGHMAFKEIKRDFLERMRENLLQCFKEEEVFGYMGGEPEWEEILKLGAME